MPELPEVQTTVVGLNKAIKGLRIVDTWTDYNSVFQKGKDSIKDPTYFRSFKKKIIGAEITMVSRRAKNILIHLNNDGVHSVLLIHMKMTGHVIIGRFVHDSSKKKDHWTPAPDERQALHDPFNRFIHFTLSLSDGKTLVLCDMRKFAKVTLISSEHMKEGALQSKHITGIGPEPLEAGFSFKVFAEQIKKRPNGRIKNVIMDQSIIAGVGNIYSDEALWRSSIHPEELVRNISENYLSKLYDATIAVLKKGIDFGGDSMSDYRNIDGERGKFQEKHEAYRRKGKPCTKKGCKGIIIRKVVGGRSAHFCVEHQKLSEVSPC